MPNETTNRKDRSARAHARTDVTKAARRATNEAQRAGNVILIKAGELTPWEQACARRAQRRAKAAKAKTGGQS